MRRKSSYGKRLRRRLGSSGLFAQKFRAILGIQKPLLTVPWNCKQFDWQSYRLRHINRINRALSFSRNSRSFRCSWLPSCASCIVAIYRQFAGQTCPSWASGAPEEVKLRSGERPCTLLALGTTMSRQPNAVKKLLPSRNPAQVAGASALNHVTPESVRQETHALHDSVTLSLSGP